MPVPRVSVITPAYNCERWIRETIESVRAQTFADWEMIVCDDGSTDATGRVADEIAARDSRVRVIHQPNSGLPAAARNSALRHVRAEFVAFLDGDDLWKPEKLARQIEFFEDHPEYGAIHSGYSLTGDPALVAEAEKIWEWPTHREATFEMVFLRNRFHISTLMIRADVARAIGEFDTDPALRGVEDYDYFLRLAARGPIANTGETLSMYRIVSGSVSHSVDYTRDRKNLLLVEKMVRLGLARDSRLVGRRRGEITYNRGIDRLYGGDRGFRRDFLDGWRSDPRDLKKAVTLASVWMPAPLLRAWLKALLAVKNAVAR